MFYFKESEYERKKCNGSNLLNLYIFDWWKTNFNDRMHHEKNPWFMHEASLFCHNVEPLYVQIEDGRGVDVQINGL